MNRYTNKHDLTFANLREANIARLPQFKNAKGEPAHSEPDGSDWTPADWLMAVVGELGEFANLLKKVHRGDLAMEEAKSNLARELADVQTYLDILAMQLGIDLGDATVEKFNEVSQRVGANVRLPTHPARRLSAVESIRPVCAQQEHADVLRAIGVESDDLDQRLLDSLRE